MREIGYQNLQSLFYHHQLLNQSIYIFFSLSTCLNFIQQTKFMILVRDGNIP